MTWIVTALSTVEVIADLEAPASWPALSRAEVTQHAPDLSLVARDGARVGARCSLWWRETPKIDGQHVGAIGHFAAHNNEAASVLLEEASRALARRGCVIAVGPMNGNTWRSYRLVTDPGTEPAFFMEPTNPTSWVAYFSTAGFAPLAYYFSGINVSLATRDTRVPELQARFAEREVTLRSLRINDFESELQRIYRVAETAFMDNFLYTPISVAQFAAQYRASAAILEPELVIIAEQRGKPVGFCFSVPDVLETKRASDHQTLILKTVAILPDRAQFSGLGALMIDATHERASQRGFTRVIHALMHESNQSRQISERSATTIRRYALFARPISE